MCCHPPPLLAPPAQEIGRPASEAHDYGSCLSVPRLLWRNPHVPHRLWQVGQLTVMPAALAQVLVCSVLCNAVIAGL
jgi:hypothetical protein